MNPRPGELSVWLVTDGFMSDPFSPSHPRATPPNSIQKVGATVPSVYHTFFVLTSSSFCTPRPELTQPFPLHREVVLDRLATLVKKFVRTVSLQRGLSEAAATAAGGKIFTFGSYRLGVHGPGSDIDTLCVVPKHVSREDFFDVFEHMLKEAEGVTEVSVRRVSLQCLPAGPFGRGSAHRSKVDACLTHSPPPLLPGWCVPCRASQMLTCRLSRRRYQGSPSTSSWRGSRCRRSRTTSHCRTTTYFGTWTSAASEV